MSIVATTAPRRHRAERDALPDVRALADEQRRDDFATSAGSRGRARIERGHTYSVPGSLAGTVEGEQRHRADELRAALLIGAGREVDRCKAGRVCRERTCPRCSARVSVEHRETIAPAIGRMSAPTLWLCHAGSCTTEDLGDCVETVAHGFGKLKSLASFRRHVAGGVAVVEVAASEMPWEMHAPHVHCVLDCGDVAGLVDAGIGDEWRRIVRAGVRVRRRRGRRGVPEVRVLDWRPTGTPEFAPSPDGAEVRSVGALARYLAKPVYPAPGMVEPAVLRAMRRAMRCRRVRLWGSALGRAEARETNEGTER